MERRNHKPQRGDTTSIPQIPLVERHSRLREQCAKFLLERDPMMMMMRLIQNVIAHPIHLALPNGERAISRLP